RHLAVLEVAHFDEAHAAARDHRERFMPAIVRHEHAREFRGLHAVELAVADLNRLVVDVNGRHFRIRGAVPGTAGVPPAWFFAGTVGVPPAFFVMSFVKAGGTPAVPGVTSNPGGPSTARR